MRFSLSHRRNTLQIPKLNLFISSDIQSLEKTCCNEFSPFKIQKFHLHNYDLTNEDYIRTIKFQ